jgi:molybdopterin-biosynthesis enzyme MoeA-like protein
MATMPIGSKPLENPVGHAPAVMVRHETYMIFSLPGVPEEMKSIFLKHVLPLLKRRIGKFVRKEVSLETKGVMESVLAPYLDIVVAKNPDVYVKSHPKGYSRGVSTLHINIAAEAIDRKTVNRYLSKAVLQMKLCVRKAGGKVKEI